MMTTKGLRRMGIMSSRSLSLVVMNRGGRDDAQQDYRKDEIFPSIIPFEIGYVYSILRMKFIGPGSCRFNGLVADPL